MGDDGGRRKVLTLWFALLATIANHGCDLSNSTVTDPVRHLSIRPGLHRAVVWFETSTRSKPVAECWSGSADPVTTSTTRAATIHELSLERLQEGTEYQLRFLEPPAARARIHRFRTTSIVVDGLKIARQLTNAKVAWSTNVPVRSFVNYWPRKNRPGAEGARQTKQISGSFTTTHSGIVDQLDADLDYTMTIISLTEDLESGPTTEFGIPSALSIINDLIKTIEGFDTRAVILRMDSLLRRLVPRDQRQVAAQARRRELERTLGPDLARLKRVCDAFAPLAGRLFSSDFVYLRAKVRVYEFLSFVDHLERFCSLEGIPFSSGLSGIDRGPFGRSFRTALSSPQVIPIEVPEPRLFMSGKLDLMEPAMFNKRESVELLVRTRDLSLSSVKRAELMMEGVLHPELYFEARVNRKVGLVLCLPPGVTYPSRREIRLYHQFPPAFLLEGENRIVVTVLPNPGTLCQLTPALDRMELRLER